MDGGQTGIKKRRRGGRRKKKKKKERIIGTGIFYLSSVFLTVAELKLLDLGFNLHSPYQY